jgi:nucleotide-binding universal stress UspA family protein
MTKEGYMEKRILAAVDGSQKGFQAVSILGHLLRGQSDFQLILFHCLQQLPTLAPGELCTISEEACRLPISAQERLGNAILQKAHGLLVEKGFPERGIELKVKLDSVDPAQDILKEAQAQDVSTIAVGRRGRSQLENLLLGSVSSKVAQYAGNRSVWVIDTPTHETHKALIAMEAESDARHLMSYACKHIAPVPGIHFTLLHMMPPVPPTFWDDGHILDPSERKDRQSRVEKWRADWTLRIEKLMEETCNSLKECHVPEKNIDLRIIPTREGIARDLLNLIAEQQYHLVLIGKKSFHERKPFLMGSHANKILQNAKGTIICLVDSK